MTRNTKLWFFSFLALTVAIIGLLFAPEPPHKTVLNAPGPKLQKLPQTANKPGLRSPGSVPARPSSQANTNSSSSPWKKRVEESLRIQGGSTVKHIEIERVDAFNWKVGKVPVAVESVLIKIQHVKGHRTSFRALIDPASGKILQTWDPPTIDDFSHKSHLEVRVDPRYHND